ncbi:MAG: toll/interleukin-1 receptor domain-containing protein [Ruminococcaceae bacterium]|nr:toll/interleukin-1 receptor domain-containing protein [Oscillospiraceae bacterium]
MNKNVFVSYAHSDAEVVNKIIKTLKAVPDVQVWYDSNLRGGEHYFSVIAESILKNDYFIFVVSKSSVMSDWCLHELEFAMSEKRKIIAIWIENTDIPAGVKLIIQNTHYIMWTEADEAELQEHIADTFVEGNVTTAKSQQNPQDDSPFHTDRYFIPQTKRRKIKELLNAEKNNQYSRCFEAENAVLIGLAYELGIETEKDMKKAEFYYRVGKHKGDIDAKYLFAALMIESDTANRKQYLQEMEEAAEEGSVLAMTYLGDSIYDGKWGLAANKEKAYEWWRKAADKGEPAAMYFMAYGYQVGECFEKDYGLALMYALSSSEHKFPRAFRILGRAYENGRFVDKDVDIALDYYQKAVSLGDLLSLCSIGGIYYWDKEDYSTAWDYYCQAETAADEGKTNSGLPYRRVGMCYYYGKGVEMDEIKGLDYMFKAVKRNHSYTKDHIAKDIAVAETITLYEKLKLLREACFYQCKEAEYRMILCLRKEENPDLQKIADALDMFDMNLESRKALVAENTKQGRSRNFREMDDIIYSLANKGSDNGDIDCIKELCFMESWVFGGDKFANREKALKSFQRLFSLAQEDELDAIYYYSYAVELAIDRQNKNPDKDHVFYYFEKCLKTDLAMWNSVASIGREYVLEKDSNLYLDVKFGEEFLMFAKKYLFESTRELMRAYLSGKPEDFTEGCLLLADGLMKLAGFYNKGSYVKKDKEKAKSLELMATEVYKFKSVFEDKLKKKNESGDLEAMVAEQLRKRNANS